MDNKRTPTVYVIGGVNGAGKSTATTGLLKDKDLQNFINPDLIARGLVPENPESAAFAAGRVVLSRIRELAASHVDIAFETTLSGRTYASLLKELKALGYRTHLVYYWLNSADLAVERVRQRVREGGHDIPEEAIRRRYTASVRNFFEIYRGLFDSWKVFDNTSGGKSTRLIAQHDGTNLKIFDQVLWENMQKPPMSDTGNIAESSASYGEEDSLTLAIRRAIQKAVLRHKLLGNPIAVGEPDGTVRIIQPEDIEVPDEIYAAYRAEVAFRPSE